MIKDIRTVIFRTSLVIAVIALVIIVGVVLFFTGSNQEQYLERRAVRVRTEVTNSFFQKPEAYYSLFNKIHCAAEEGSLFYTPKQPPTELSEKVEKSMDAFSQSTHMKFDSIQYPGMWFYPSDSCVFRKDIHYANGDLYCWIDLVYSPYWESEFDSGTLEDELDLEIITRLDANWCIVKLYGY